MTWEDAAKTMTLEEAIEAYKYGISLEVNDGKDITVVIERMKEDWMNTEEM